MAAAIGLSTVAHAQVRLGIAGPVTGAAAAFGSQLKNGAEQAVEDINAACAQMVAEGATITGDGKPKIGAHGKPVIFLHPKDFNGTLIELEQV